jgi:hypothetical protein
MISTSKQSAWIWHIFKFAAMSAIMFCALSSPIFADYARDLETARRFVAIGKFEEALEPLERLFAQNPKDKQIALY